MTVDDVKKEKKQLERDISLLCRVFEDNSGVIIDRINIDRLNLTSCSGIHLNSIHNIDVEVTL